MSEYFPALKLLGGWVKVKLDLSNYAKIADIKTLTGVGTSKFAKKVDLANSESNVEKLDVDKLLTVPVDLSKPSDIVKNSIVKKDVYNAKIKTIEDEIPDITNLATDASLNTKINEFKGEMHSITNLGTTAVLNAKRNEFKSEIPNITNLVTITTNYYLVITNY